MTRTTRWLLVLSTITVAACAAMTSREARTDQPVEYGRIEWRRDFDAALADAKKNKRPVMVLFQEVPG